MSEELRAGGIRGCYCWIARRVSILHTHRVIPKTRQSISREMLKRTTIGVELAAKPKLLLFLDEPRYCNASFAVTNV